jgi:hypothetical protein
VAALLDEDLHVHTFTLADVGIPVVAAHPVAMLLYRMEKIGDIFLGKSQKVALRGCRQ